MLRKALPVLFVLSVLCLSATACLAGQSMPALKGVWSTKTEGGVIVWADAPGRATHWEHKQTALTGELEIKEQNGRVLSGEFRSAKGAERFIGVIGLDDVSLYFADSDGTFDGKLVDPDTIQVLYRHVTPKDTVVAVGLWTRRK